MKPPAKGGGRRIVKKKGGGHGHHGGAWKVAYADFVTAMMALFMVMWLLASTDSTSRKEIANYFRTGILPEGDLSMGRASQFQPAIVEETGKPPPTTSAAVQQQAKDLKNAIAAMAKGNSQLAKLVNQVTVKATDDGVLIEAVDQDGGPSMLFDVASTELKPALTEFLDKLAPTLAATDGTIEIHGHTDARRFPSKATRNNWTLSFDRAENARIVLESAGLAPGRVDRVVAHAATQLLVPEEPLNPRNRRLSLLVKPIVREASAAPVPAKAGAKPALPGSTTPAATPTGAPAATDPAAAEPAAPHHADTAAALPPTGDAAVPARTEAAKTEAAKVDAPTTEAGKTEAATVDAPHHETSSRSTHHHRHRETVVADARSPG